VRIAETRHVVQTTAADNAYLCLVQVLSCFGGWDE
jgi:hypothetical protein